MKIFVDREPIRVLGIDLGTTNSTVAEIAWEPGRPVEPEPRRLEVEQPTLSGPRTSTVVPSFVALHQGRVLVNESSGSAEEPAIYLLAGERPDRFSACLSKQVQTRPASGRGPRRSAARQNPLARMLR